MIARSRTRSAGRAGTGAVDFVAVRRRTAVWLAGAAVAIAFCAMPPATDAESRVSAYDVESAYLFNFGKFVRLAPDAENRQQNFDICIVGDDPLGTTLDALTAHEKLDGRPVRVLRLKTAAEARKCAIAYISASEGDRLGTDLDMLRGRPVLTVSDAADFMKRGGMIQLIVADGHVRFAVNLDAVRSAGLGLSSELLRVAVSVNGQVPSEVRP